MIKQASFITSAANKSNWIDDDVSEICLIGRSNVGKSSFINSLTNNNKLAKISNTPGKTRLLNFFEINKGEYRLVDAPGYGYAKVDDNLKIQFAKMMEEYFINRKNLKGVFLLLDLRHKPSNDDIMMYQFLKHYNIPVVIIGTKLDKLKKSEYIKNEKMIKETINFYQEDDFIKISNLDKTNIIKCYELIDKLLGSK
ncbi:ribosome biogenesis GTP-binding protein YihA/YsxC [Mycoplasma mycoides]|uniref:Probable GTP-binding protein EngB n=1 Tax=Mycoplasma mycoides subsp. capri LC str. 95010 TaxID=862259 RepID=F4MPE7_MYCML|nr:ribosome biogenesis GTP-binding protein YihA/YsxC [Mycoplasma mycoides]QQY78474.1 YihA family ribosome biogenesis GTP-binding protein [Mycoplasma mycoides subsp. capri]QVK02205.1 YihA family ribosome biogenesis GTP-binding protein [Mycoplasma mycoides subsp. capri]QVK05438.1 YihA family ribosome biogenesis GTP-binding protein [Mycoplasma mycoides subsp. capri]QVK06224.1 YihA family ribosome biogenesis GTP-binding protein [Mycoplasma mycoides subsp. capri]QVK08751.1 YihA family ribosome biog